MAKVVTKAELEAKIVRLEAALDKALEVPREVLAPPSPVDRGELYVESHPILGVTRRATVVTSQSVGDGRVGDGATIVRE